MIVRERIAQLGIGHNAPQKMMKTLEYLKVIIRFPNY
jgi:hypothetical protein